MRFLTTRLLLTLLIAPLTLWLVPAPAALAQKDTPTPVLIVALDECDPTTFNAVLGPDFCKNVALAFVTPFATTFEHLFAEAAAGTPDPSWDFEPDSVTITKGTPLIVVNQGGEEGPPADGGGGPFVAGLPRAAHRRGDAHRTLAREGEGGRGRWPRPPLSPPPAIERTSLSCRPRPSPT